MTRQIPNALTLARIALIPLLVAALLIDGPAMRWLAVLVFLAASATDWVDGHLARRWDAHSPFGRMLDPIADKLLVAAALVMLVAKGQLAGLHVLPAIVILCREILVSGLREYLAGIAVSVPVTVIAKTKTALQFIAIACLIGAAPLDAVLPGALGFGLIAIWLAAAVTLYTGYEYWQAGMAEIAAKTQKAAE